MQYDAAVSELALNHGGIGVLFSAMRDAVVIGDVSTGQIALLNPAAEKLFGYASEEALGLAIEELVANSLKDRHCAGLNAYAATKQGALIESGIPVELTAVRKDGVEIAVELSLTPMPSSLGDGRYVMALIRDVTARQRLETERQGLLTAARDYGRRLEELAILQAEFSAMVAHELGTPVAAIRGLSDLLHGGHVPLAQQASLIDAIRAEANLLQTLVTDVQMASAIERDEFTVRPRPVTVAALLADAAAFARSLGDGHPISDTYDDAVATSVVAADPGRIGQVLRNLLNNAVKHTPVGTPIEVRAFCMGSTVRFEVADRGPGIDPEDLARIFEKFSRGRDARGRKTPGVGLGLYLSRRIIRAHGGELTVSSVPFDETVFAFDLKTT